MKSAGIFRSTLQIDGGFNVGQHFAGSQFFDRPLQQLAIQIESNRFDVAVLLSAKQVARAAQLEIERGNAEARPQFAELPNRRKPAAGDLASSVSSDGIKR